MTERGQVFTLDMFFALTLTAMIVSYSGLALEGARRQAEDYALRYSLERMANDAADVLVKTLGRPENWEKDAVSVTTPGFSRGAVNHISLGKMGALARIFREWDNMGWENAVNASKELFGGLETVEVALYDENEGELWRIWPRYDVENSTSENSTETVVVKRLVIANYGENRYSTGSLKRQTGNVVESTASFWIGPGELEVFDWYLVVVTSDRQYGVPIEVFINESPPRQPPYKKFQKDDFPTDPPYQTVWPNSHGGMESDPYLPARDENLRENAYNTIAVDLQGSKKETVIVYVVALPACSTPEKAEEALVPLLAALEVKMWR